MITVSVKINRPAKVVWDYFTTISNWSKWYGDGVKAITPSWQQGAKIVWESGGDAPITKFVLGEQISLYGAWMDVTYKFVRQGSSATTLQIVESDLKRGASFDDGGVAHKAELENMLQKFKKCVEEETSVTASQGQKIGFLSRLFGKKQYVNPSEEQLSTTSDKTNPISEQGKKVNFFIPDIDDPDLAEKTYQAIRSYAKTSLGWDITERRILSVTYSHEGRQHHDEVGQICQSNNEIVIAILESNAYLVCTPTRGVVMGMPILVGGNEIISTQDFDKA